MAEFVPRAMRPRCWRQTTASLALFARQALTAVVTLFIISVITFGAMNVRSSESVALDILGKGAAPEQIDVFVEAHGLNHPVHERYVEWFSDFVKGDWGTSYVTQTEIRPEILDRFGRSLLLAAIALVAAVPLGIIFGVSSALRYGGLADRAMNATFAFLAAVPEFIVGLVLLIIFGTQLGLLPVDSTGVLFGTFSDKSEAYVLPAATLMLAIIPYIARITRASAREALLAPYVQSAILRGLPRRRVLWNHAVRNASGPLVHAIALNIVFLLSGVIVVENVFAFPGIGQAIVSAVGSGDSIVVQAIVLLMGAAFIGISLAADAVGLWLDPRLRRTRA
jgi:peptide/nickel transport system permease protein